MWQGIRLACGCVRSASPTEAAKEQTICCGRYLHDQKRRMQDIVERMGAPSRPHLCNQPAPVVVEESAPVEAPASAPVPDVEAKPQEAPTPTLLTVAGGQLTFGALLGIGA